MKTIATIFSISALLIGGLSFGQELVPDQNPNYKTSMNKYMEVSDSLIADQSTTKDDTYEAYDWTEAKAAKKQERQDRRYEWRKYKYDRRYPQYPNQYYNTPYNQPNYYNNYNPYYQGAMPYYFWF